jgi:hypothetical protein
MLIDDNAAMAIASNKVLMFDSLYFFLRMISTRTPQNNFLPDTADLRHAHEKVVQRALRHGNGTEGSATH